jgi:arylsulfatase A-like enzyme
MRFFRGLKIGAFFAALHFTMDLIGATLAIGFLFDPTLASTILVLIAFLISLTLGACLGAIVGIVTPAKVWNLKPPRRGLMTGLILVALSITLLSYNLRAKRQAPTLAKRSAQSGRAHLESPPPILWVIMDTLRADTLYGPLIDFPLAPNLGQFAQNAITFKDAESSSGWTIPAMATMLTGIHNTTTDASSGILPLWVKTLPEYLYDAGYSTHALVDNVIVEPRAGFAQGFETYFQRSGFRFAFSLPTFRLMPEKLHHLLREALVTSYYGAPRLTNRAIDVIAQPHTQPLFLYVHYMDPHAPYHPHPEISPDPPTSEPVDYYVWRDILRKDVEDRPSPGQTQRLKHRYDNEIIYMDKAIGRLLKAWHEQFGENGLIIFTSDHGEEFLDHGHLGHGHTVHREMVNVPLMMRFPDKDAQKFGQPATVDKPVSQIDLLPSMLDYLGLQAERTPERPLIQGKSFLAQLQGQAPWGNQPIIASHGRHGRRTYRYRVEDTVYIKTMFYDKRPTTKELYELKSDPREQKNLIADKEFLQAINFQEFTKQFENTARALVQKGKTHVDKSREDQNIESLRALGYIH